MCDTEVCASAPTPWGTRLILGSMVEDKIKKLTPQCAFGVARGLNGAVQGGMLSWRMAGVVRQIKPGMPRSHTKKIGLHCDRKKPKYWWNLLAELKQVSGINYMTEWL